MTESLRVIGIAWLALVSTSVDNLGTLVAFFAASDVRPHSVWEGYLAAACVVGAAAWATSQLALLLPSAWLGALGIVPITLGVRGAWRLRRPELAALAPPKAAGALAVALVTLAQSTDNFAVYAALFADSATEFEPLLYAALAVGAVAWCALGFWLGRRSPLAGALQRVARFVLPVLLIAVGAYILSDTTTDVVRTQVGLLP